MDESIQIIGRLKGFNSVYLIQGNVSIKINPNNAKDLRDYLDKMIEEYEEEDRRIKDELAHRRWDKESSPSPTTKSEDKK